MKRIGQKEGHESEKRWREGEETDEKKLER